MINLKVLSHMHRDQYIIKILAGLFSAVCTQSSVDVVSLSLNCFLSEPFILYWNVCQNGAVNVTLSVCQIKVWILGLEFDQACCCVLHQCHVAWPSSSQAYAAGQMASHPTLEYYILYYTGKYVVGSVTPRCPSPVAVNQTQLITPAPPCLTVSRKCFCRYAVSIFSLLDVTHLFTQNRRCLLLNHFSVWVHSRQFGVILQ